MRRGCAEVAAICCIWVVVISAIVYLVSFSRGVGEGRGRERQALVDRGLLVWVVDEKTGERDLAINHEQIEDPATTE